MERERAFGFDTIDPDEFHVGLGACIDLELTSRRCVDTELLADLARGCEIVILSGIDVTGRGGIPHVRVHVFDGGTFLDEDLARAIEREDMHGAVAQHSAMDLGPGRLSDDLIGRIHEIENFCPYIGHGCMFLRAGKRFAQKGIIAPMSETSTNSSTQVSKIIDRLEEVVIGKRDVLELIFAALIADGHVLIEDVPGLAKTIAARALAKSIALEFGRVQMTPDLLPADLTGTGIWDEHEREFAFRKGPIFANVLLADELNRATPRTQAGLLEAMEERHVTADGVRHKLPAPFFVMATQNPIEQFGVFPLPEAQLDRFLVQVSMGYPAAAEDEVAILKAQAIRHPIDDLESSMTADELLELRKEAREIHVSDPVMNYIVELVRATRNREEVSVGASPRASIALHRMARAIALIQGESFVRPDHVKQAAPAVLRHRIILTPQSRLAGATRDEIIAIILSIVDAPVYEENS